VHLGCPVQPNGPVDDEAATEERTESTTVTRIPTNPAGFGCPCHGGQYDIEGNRTAGPPVRAMDRYEFSVRNGRLLLGKTYSVGEVRGEGREAVIVKYDATFPGVHVDGPEQILYPIEPPR
jgi:Rieske Fe-S protein